MCKPQPKLSDLTISVSKSAFVRAKSFKITKAVGLYVYRSVWLAENDSWLAPVAEVLNKYPHVLVRVEIRKDEWMIHGEAEMKVYALGETDDEADDAAVAIIEASFDMAGPAVCASIPDVAAAVA